MCNVQAHKVSRKMFTTPRLCITYRNSSISVMNCKTPIIVIYLSTALGLQKSQIIIIVYTPVFFPLSGVECLQAKVLLLDIWPDFDLACFIARMPFLSATHTLIFGSAGNKVNLINCGCSGPPASTLSKDGSRVFYMLRELLPLNMAPTA